MFLLQSPKGARWPAVNYLLCFTCTRQRAWPVSLCQRRIGWKSQIVPTPLSFSTLIRGDPFRIYGKALRFPKLESSRHLMVNIACAVFDWSTSEFTKKCGFQLQLWLFWMTFIVHKKTFQQFSEGQHFFMGRQTTGPTNTHRYPHITLICLR